MRAQGLAAIMLASCLFKPVHAVEHAHTADLPRAGKDAYGADRAHVADPTQGATAADALSRPERLSTWLLRRVPTPSDYPAGLMWLVDDEKPRQTGLRLELEHDLERTSAQITVNREGAAHARAAQRLLGWMRTLPVTGRVPVRSGDPRWLEVNPTADPVLGPGRRAIVPRRPSTVTVITDAGERCVVTHAAGVEARVYVEAWIAQPDGHMQHASMARWNEKTQDEPAPGAWIWAPSRDSGWDDRLSERLILFVATQGPAPDPEQQASIRALMSTERNDSAALTGLKPPRSRSLELSATDWGGTGLMQTPSARMHDAGYFGLNVSRVQPYTNMNVTLQPLDWLETAFRYSSISSQLYGPEIAGSQAYKDKSIDIKLRMVQETAHVPEFALGLRDLTGTGLFSSEFLVASKRTGPFDWSAGLGWGYLAGRRDLPNPLSVLSDSFNTRTNNIGQGGNFSLSAFFHGRTALFGGVQYQTPWQPLLLKLELDGNNYQHEPFGSTLPQRSPLNAGMVYRLGPALDLSLGVERGNTLMLGFTMHTQLDGLAIPKPGDPPRISVRAERPRAGANASVAAMHKDLVSQTQWQVTQIEQRGRDLHVTLDDPIANYWRERVDRAASVLHRDASPEVDRFRLAYRENGVDMVEHVIDRDAWVAAQTEPLPPRAQRDTIIAQAPRAAEGGGNPEDARPHAQAAGSGRTHDVQPDASVETSTLDDSQLSSAVAPVEIFKSARDPFESGLGIGLRQNLGGPNAFLLYQVSAVEQFKYRFRDDLWLQGLLNLGLIDNYKLFTYDAPSNLPRVRTYLREYLTTSRLTMPNLQLTKVGDLGRDQYYSLYGGYLESMFAGVGGEWLYRPLSSRFALGVDVNYVKQRDFRQNFGFSEAGDQTGYKVATGHGTLYWDTGWNDVQMKLSAGRYLAGDIGATMQLSRRFDNGVVVGAYATKTNVSAVQFGEGSFDKGIFVSVPLDAYLTKSSGTISQFAYHPLVRDGGAKLDRAVNLYDVTRLRDDRALRTVLPTAPTTAPDRARDLNTWATQREPNEAWTHVEPKLQSPQWSLDDAGMHALTAALSSQDFRNIRVSIDSSRTLRVSVTRDRVEAVSFAAGRAARTALRFAPIETRTLRVDYARRGVL